MLSSQLFAQALSIAFAAGVNLSATVATLGLLAHTGWIDTLPGGLAVLANWWIIGIALTLAAVDFVATLVPGVASAWATGLTLVRPAAGAVLALAATLQLDPVVTTAAALLGGGLALTTHGAVTGLRYAVDTSPEPVSNFATNVAALTTVVSVSLALWRHPYVTLAAALALLVLVVLLVRAAMRAVRRAFAGLARGARARTG